MVVVVITIQYQILLLYNRMPYYHTVVGLIAIQYQVLLFDNSRTYHHKKLGPITLLKQIYYLILIGAIVDSYYIAVGPYCPLVVGSIVVDPIIYQQGPITLYQQGIGCPVFSYTGCWEEYCAVESLLLQYGHCGSVRTHPANGCELFQSRDHNAIC